MDHPVPKLPRNRPTLYSVWQTNIVLPTVVDVCNPPMMQYSFTCITVAAKTTGTVVFSTSSEAECIDIASDWQDGESKWKAKEPFHDTGFIGQGYSK